MPKSVTVPGKGTISFPDEMSDTDINSAVSNWMKPAESPAPFDEKAAQTGINAALAITGEIQRAAPILGMWQKDVANEEGYRKMGEALDQQDIEENVGRAKIPTTGEQSTIYGGPPASVTTPAQMPRVHLPFLGEHEDVPFPQQESMLPIPELPPVEKEEPSDFERMALWGTPGGAAMKMAFGDDVAAQVVREAINQGLAIPRFLTSPIGLASIPAAEAAPLTTTAYFAADTLKNLYGHLKDTIEGWPDMTAPQKARAIVQGLGLGTLAGFLTHGTMGLAKNRLAGQPSQGVKELLDQYRGVQRPEEVQQSYAPKAEPMLNLPVQPSGTTGKFPTFEKPEFQHPPLPKREGPAKGRGPYKNIDGVLVDADGNIVDPQGNIVQAREKPAGAPDIPVPKVIGPQPQEQTPELDVRLEEAKQILPNAAAQAAQEKGAADAIQKQSADEEMLRNARLQREGGLPGVRPEDTQPQGAAAKGKPPEEVDYEKLEREAIDEAGKLGAGVKIEDTTPEENEPFAGRVAYARPDGTMVINRTELKDFLNKVPPAQRAELVRSVVNEEHIHGKTDRRDALGYWRDLTGFEQGLVKLRYTGNLAGTRGKGGRPFSETQLGFEAVRGRIQQLAHQTPREIVEAVGREKWGIRSIYALEKTVFNIRRALGTKASKRQMEILDRVQFNLKVAKNAMAGTQMRDQPETFNREEFLRKQAEEDSKKQFWQRYGIEYIDALDKIAVSLKDTFHGVDPTNVRLKLAALPAKLWPEEAAQPHAGILEKYWESFPKERLEDAEVGLALMKGSLNRRRIAQEEHWSEERLKNERMAPYEVTGESIADSRQEIKDSEKFVAQLRKDIAGPEHQVFPETYNQRKKKDIERRLAQLKAILPKLVKHDEFHQIAQDKIAALEKQRDALPEAYNQFYAPKAVKESEEFNYYLTRLRNPELLDKAVPLDQEGFGKKMLAVPTGGDRVSGSVGCAELFTLMEGKKIMEQLKGKEGFERVRLTKHKGYDIPSMRNSKWSVDWGKDIPWIDWDKVDRDRDWEQINRMHDQLGKQFGYHNDSMVPEIIDKYEPFHETGGIDPKQMDLPFAYNRDQIDKIHKSNIDLMAMWMMEPHNYAINVLSKIVKEGMLVDPGVAKVAKRLLELGDKDVKFRVPANYGDFMQWAQAQLAYPVYSHSYFQKTRTIATPGYADMLRDFATRGPMFPLAEVFVHEYAHSVTTAALHYKKSSRAAKEIKELLADAQHAFAMSGPGLDPTMHPLDFEQYRGLDYDKFNIAYGLRNSMELVAQAFSSPSMRTFLKRITPQGAKMSVWDKLVSATGKLVGLKGDSALDHVMDAGFELANRRKPLKQRELPWVFNRDEQNKRKKAEKDTAPLPLSFGKRTEEGEFKKDLTAKPTGTEVGLKPGAYYAEKVHEEAMKFIDQPITITKTRKAVPGKLDEYGQPVIRTSSKIERPRMREFTAWAKVNHPAVTEGQLYEMWQSIVWDNLIKAPSARLKEWVQALDLREKLEGKGYERREMREIPEYSASGDVQKQAAAPVKPKMTELGFELPMKEALGPVTRAQQIEELRKEAANWEERASKAAPVRPVIQESMFGDLGVEPPKTKGGKAVVPRTAREMLERAKQLRDRADAIEHVAAISVEGQKSKAQYQRPQDYRMKVIGEIGIKLLKEAEPKAHMLEPKDIFAADINWDNPNATTSPWHEFGDLSLFDREKLMEHLTDQARITGAPVSWSRRMVVLHNPKTGEVVFSSIFKDGRRGLKIPEPTGGKGTVTLDSVMKTWQPFASVLIKDPTTRFRKGFHDMAEFDDYIRREALERKTKEFEELKDLAPPEIAEQAFEDEVARDEQEEANREALLAEERVDPKDVEALVRQRFGEQGGEGLPETKVEGEGGTFQGPHADIVRESTAEGEMRRNAPITSAEALEVLNLFAMDRKKYKVDSIFVVHKAIDNLMDRAKSGTLKPKHWLAINGLRKAARAIFDREQERIRIEKQNTQLTAARKALGLEEEQKFTIEDAYRAALTEFYEITRDTDTDQGFINEAMGRFAEKAEDVGTPARGAASRTAKELELKRTALRPDVMGGLPKEVEVPTRAPTANPWKQYETQFRRAERFSDDPYQQWLARYSRTLPQPMPFGGIRGVAEHVPKLDVQDMKWVEEHTIQQYQPTPDIAAGPEYEQRNLTLAEYDSGKRTEVKPTRLTPEEKEIRRQYALKHPDIGKAAGEGEKFYKGISEPITQRGEVAKRQRARGTGEIDEADFDSPETYNRKKEDIKGLVSEFRDKMREAYNSTWKWLGETNIPKEGMADIQQKAGAWNMKMYQNAKTRHIIKDKLYYTLDNLDNNAAGYALTAGNAIKLASMDVISGEGVRALEFRKNQQLGLKRREAAKAIIASRVPIKNDKGEFIVDAKGEKIMRVSRTQLKKMISMAELGINGAEKWIRSSDLQKKIYGKKWLEAARKLRDGAQYAQSEYLDAIAEGKKTGKSVWENHPLNQTIKEFDTAMKENRQFMIDNGILVKERENYVPGRYEGEVFSDNMIAFGASKVLGMEPRKQKAFKNYYEAIANAHGPYLPVNGDVAELAQSSIVASHRMINRRTWEMALHGLTDPHTGMPIARTPKQIPVDSIVKDPVTGDPVTVTSIKYDSPSAKYQLVYPNGDKNLVPVAVLPSYAKMMEAALAPSMMRHNTVMEAGLRLSSMLKHGVVLIFDTFHPFRLGQYALAAGGTIPGMKGWLDPRVGYRGGYSALNFNPGDMAKAVDSGWIPKEAAEWAMGSVKVNVTRVGPGPLGWRKYTTQERMTRQKIAQKMTTEWGLNAVKLNDVMYRDAVRSLPIVGNAWHDFLSVPNRWIFDKFTTGLMVETAVRNFERMNKETPAEDYNKLGRFIAKDINVLYGNMGRQGVFRNQTFRDLATMILLAPMWREGLIQKDLRFAGRSLGWTGSRMAKALQLGYKDKTWQELPQMGTLGRAYLRGLLTYFILAQITNLITRHRLTWQNPEDDHKMDAWLPTGKGQSDGVWVSTFGVFGEFTHQLMTLLDKKPTAIEAGLQIGVNAMGPVGRAAMAMGTGKDPEGSKATTSFQWLKNVGNELTPSPISAALPFKLAARKLMPEYFEPPRKGEAAQRVLGVMGVKAQLPSKYQNQMMDLVGKWTDDEQIPRDAVIMQPTDQDSYTKLRRAIWMENPEGARVIYQGLIKNYLAKHPQEGYADAMDHIQATMTVYTERPWTGNQELEPQFMAWLVMKHHEKAEIMLRAQAERQREFAKFLIYLPKMAKPELGSIPVPKKP